MSRMWGDDPADRAALDRWITREPEWHYGRGCEGCDAPVDEDATYCDDCNARAEADAANDDTDTDTKGDTTMNTTTNTANDNSNSSTTPTLDTVLAVLCATVRPRDRWALEGWAAHVRPARHQIHAASSYAKHEQEFRGLAVAMRALTVARCVDFGVSADDARALIDARREARAAKAAAA